MEISVQILPSAWEDLKKIEDYYLVEFDVDTALKVSNHILDCIEKLETFPEIGVYTPDKWLNDRGYRMVIAGQHVAVFKRIESMIYVYHIADTRTDYPMLFKDKE